MVQEDEHPVRRQIAALEAQLLSLRDLLALFPADQRMLDSSDMERARRALAQLGALFSAAMDDWTPSMAAVPDFPTQLRPDQDSLVWTTERTTRLYAISTSLSIALTEAQAAHVVTEQALPALSADAGVIMLSVDGATLKPIDVAGDGGMGSMLPVAIDDASPFGQAVQTAQSVWLESPEDMATLYGSPVEFPWSGAASLAAIPLIAEGRVLGVMAFRFDVPRSFTMADRAFMLVLAQQCAAALERVHLYEQVRQAAALEERNRLARDLHDSVSQALYAIILGVTAGRANLDRDLGRVGRALDNIESLAAAAQADLRALLFDLRADSVKRTGLVNALLERAQFLRQRHNLAVRTELSEEPAIGPVCKEALYGIAREALHNSVKHARAKKVEVKLSVAADSLVLEIADDGIGFEPDILQHGHYGLQSMRERAAELGADLRVESGRGQGTRVVVVVPVLTGPPSGHEGYPCAWGTGD